MDKYGNERLRIESKRLPQFGPEPYLAALAALSEAEGAARKARKAVVSAEVALRAEQDAYPSRAAQARRSGMEEPPSQEAELIASLHVVERERETADELARIQREALAALIVEKQDEWVPDADEAATVAEDEARHAIDLAESTLQALDDRLQFCQWLRTCQPKRIRPFKNSKLLAQLVHPVRQKLDDLGTPPARRRHGQTGIKGAVILQPTARGLKRDDRSVFR